MNPPDEPLQPAQDGVFNPTFAGSHFVPAWLTLQNIMRLRTACLFFGLAGVFIAALSGCISLDQAFADQTPFRLVSPLASFQAQYHRWPGDYPELSKFVQQSGGFAPLGHYDRVYFTELPNGALKVGVVGVGTTNLNEMTIGPATVVEEHSDASKPVQK